MSDLNEYYKGVVQELNGGRFQALCRVHPTAKVHDTTMVWDGANILADVVIGHNCNIGGNVEIGRGSKIGNYTRVGYGSFLPPNSQVGNQVFIGPGVYCADDRHPFIHVQGEDPPYTPEPPVIEDGAVIGIGAVLLPGVRVGREAIVAAGSVVSRDVPAYTTVKGPAARQHLLSENAAMMFRGHAGVSAE